MMDLAQGKPVLDREGEHNKYFYKSIGTGVNNTVLPATTGAKVVPAIIANGKFHGGIVTPVPIDL
jgi:1-pyrroline-5-carboxylate dehydrogenase